VIYVKQVEVVEAECLLDNERQSRACALRTIHSNTFHFTAVSSSYCCTEEINSTTTGRHWSDSYIDVGDMD